MKGPFSDDLLSRIEDAGINASAPREQRWIDGWLVRFSPGKAKRARCVQAVAAGREALDQRLERCLAVYAQAGLRPYFRITPFSLPSGLDADLAARGMERIDDTKVMVATIAGEPAAPARSDALARTVDFRPADAETFAAWVGQQRGSPLREQAAHADRLRQSPVRHCALLAFDVDGVPVAGGQVAMEADLAGLYDVFTSEASRGRGLARELCRALLRLAAAEGVRVAYLQVEANNAPARRIYLQLGFADAYAYHYRSPPAP